MSTLVMVQGTGNCETLKKLSELSHREVRVFGCLKTAKKYHRVFKNCGKGQPTALKLLKNFTGWLKIAENVCKEFKTTIRSRRVLHPAMLSQSHHQNLYLAGIHGQREFLNLKNSCSQTFKVKFIQKNLSKVCGLISANIYENLSF